MFNRKDKEIIDNTKRIAKGTYILYSMPEKTFIETYQRMEKSNAKSPCKYKLPEWFTIKFIDKENKTAEFLGSFNDGNGYPLVYKDKFLKLLKKYHVNFEEMEDNTYKIIRK